MIDELRCATVALRLPGRSNEGRPSGDQDTFTLVVAAARGLAARRDLATATAITVVGVEPESIARLLPQALGIPPPANLVITSRGESSPEALTMPFGAAGPMPQLVLIASLGSRTEGEAPAGLALWLESGPGFALRAAPPGSRVDRSGLLWLRPAAEATAQSPSTLWQPVVDGPVLSVEPGPCEFLGWEESGSPAPSGPEIDESSARSEESGASAVSQGAYVPRPTYLDSLPSRWRLTADRCGHCGSLTFPQRNRCRACGRGDRLAGEAMGAESARIEAITTVGAGGQPTEFDDQVAREGSYDVAVVELSEGMRGTFQLTDVVPGRSRPGDRVRFELRRLYRMDDEWRYGLKAVPLLAS